MRGIVPTVTAPKMRSGGIDPVEALQKRLATDPNWNGGWYYENGGIAKVLEEIRYDTLVQYGQRELLATTIPDPVQRDAAIRAAARAWAQTYDGHSLVALRKAIGRFDITAEYSKIRAKVLYVIAPNDKLFPGTIGPGFAADLRTSGVDITYVELVTDKGHLASHADAAQWAPMLRAFLASL
jgi:homoserine O-acetyltransferase